MQAGSRLAAVPLGCNGSSCGDWCAAESWGAAGSACVRESGGRAGAPGRRERNKREVTRLFREHTRSLEKQQIE